MKFNITGEDFINKKFRIRTCRREKHSKRNRISPVLFGTLHRVNRYIQFSSLGTRNFIIVSIVSYAASADDEKPNMKYKLCCFHNSKTVETALPSLFCEL